MSLLLEEFTTDLKRITKLLDMLELLREFSSVARNPSPEAPPDASQTPNQFFEYGARVHQISLDHHADLVILSGTLVLYIAGRFEAFVRSLFEELADSIATKCNSYDKLPKTMRGSLITYTADVMKEPRKYGHGDKGVETFVQVLAANLNDRSKLDSINSSCLSITYENMRPDVLKSLFDRIGAEKIWEKIGSQAAIQIHFETDQPGQATNECIKMLNVFMDTRNAIAHPASNVTWPDSAKVRDYIRYFHTLAGALDQICQMYEITIPNRGTS